jgi:hypothetical protein
MKWLDTETKALLQGVPPEKLASPATATFTLVLLAVGELGYNAILNTIQRAANVSIDEAERFLRHRLQIPVKRMAYPIQMP